MGGLTLALLLRQRGIAAEVLEQSTELREVGAAVSLAANATRVIAHLGLGEALAQVSTEPTALIHRDGRDGHRIAVTPGPQWYRDTFGAPFMACTGRPCSGSSPMRSGPTTCTWTAASNPWRNAARGCGCAARRAPSSRPAWWWARTACTRWSGTG